MSAFYDLASLVLVPSGYKTSKVYAQKPLTTDGQLAFTRSTTATRVASNGLIEKVRTNVVLYSENQSNAAYSSVINQITSRTAVANPLTGSSNAYKILSAGGTDPYIGQTISGLSNGENTFSLWLWTDSGQDVNCDLIFYNATASEIYTKSVILTTTPTRYEHTVNFTTVGANATIRLDLCQSCGVTYVYTYGWQVESGVATDYIATTTAAVSVGPVANVPRLDYLNSSCPRLLLESQRTNVLNFSESFDNAYWNKAGTTITANNTTSPDGYTNADRLTSSGAGNDEYIQRAGLSTTAGTYTSSIFVKNVNATQTVLMAVHLGEGSVTSDLRYTWSTGAFTINGTNAVSGKATSYGNGWVRLEFTYTIGASVSGHWFRTYVQTGVSTNSIFIYGASVELGAYATSYIPTLGAAVTRGADAASKTGIGSLIGGTSGTIFFEIKTNKTLSSELYKQFFYYTDASANQAYMYITSSNQIQTNVSLGNFLSSLVLVADTTYKVAIAYALNDFKLFIDGVDRGGSVSGTPINPVNLASLGSFNGTAEFNEFTFLQYLHFKTRLTNAQLAELTA